MYVDEYPPSLPLPFLLNLLTPHISLFHQSYHLTFLFSSLVFIQIMSLLVTWVGFRRRNHLIYYLTLPYNLIRPLPTLNQPSPGLNQYSHKNSFHPTRLHHINNHRNRPRNLINLPNNKPNPIYHSSTTRPTPTNPGITQTTKHYPHNKSFKFSFREGGERERESITERKFKSNMGKIWLGLKDIWFGWATPLTRQLL